MPLTLEYLGHSGFVFSDGTHTLAVDPFLTGNPAATKKPGEITCDFIALTHGHADHMADAAVIARSNHATVIAAYEICEYLGEDGCETEPGNPGGKIQTPFGWVAFTQAFHSSSYKGEYMGMACGLMIHMGGVTVYHCGDTTIFGDMALLADIYKPKVALVPVGDRFTMGPDLAERAVGLIKPEIVVPIHYDTWPPIEQDLSGWKPAGVDVRAMKPGDTLQVG